VALTAYAPVNAHIIYIYQFIGDTLLSGFFGFDEVRDSAADSEAVETNIFSSVFRETTLKLGMLRGGESLIVHVNLTPTRKINDDTGRYSRA